MPRKSRAQHSKHATGRMHDRSHGKPFCLRREHPAHLFADTSERIKYTCQGPVCKDYGTPCPTREITFYQQPQLNDGIRVIVGG